MMNGKCLYQLLAFSSADLAIKSLVVPINLLAAALPSLWRGVINFGVTPNRRNKSVVNLPLCNWHYQVKHTVVPPQKSTNSLDNYRYS